MPKPRRYGGLIALLLLAALGAGLYFWRSGKEKGAAFYTSPVKRGPLVQSITATGIIQPFLDVLVSSQISGYIDTVAVDFNSRVKKGDILATLLPTNYRAAVKLAEADLANAKANFQLQSVTLRRDKELLEKNLIAQSDYDTAAALVDEAAAQVAAKTANLDTAGTNLSYCAIRSPIDGIVIKRAVDVGNSVAATLNSPVLFEIGNDLTKMQIDAAVSEADIGNVAEAQLVHFTVDAYPNRQFEGRVRQIRNAPQTQQNVVIYDVMIDVENADLKLKPGMTANASVVVASRDQALILPNAALRFRMPQAIVPEPADAAKPSGSGNRSGGGGGNGTGGKRGNADAPEGTVSRILYRLAGEGPAAHPEAVRYKLGITDGTGTEILSGLAEGDRVITGVNTSATSRSANPFGGFRRGF